jgi:hypothetical protein
MRGDNVVPRPKTAADSHLPSAAADWVSFSKVPPYQFFLKKRAQNVLWTRYTVNPAKIHNMSRNRKMRAEHEATRSHPFKWMPPLINPTRLERFATVTATLLCVELVISHSAFTNDTGFLSRALLPIGLLGVINIPFYFLIRSSGIRRFHFLEHEAHLDETHYLPAASRSRGASTDTHGEMHALIQAIDAADVWDRQAARNTLKAWVVTNRSRLDKAAWAYLREQVGYLLPDESTPPHIP